MAMMKCPKCGSTYKFYIDAVATVEVDGENGYVEDHDGFMWGGDSRCECDECAHSGFYQDFKVYEGGDND